MLAAGPGGVAGSPAAGQAGGEAVEEAVVDPAGHDRGQGGVAVIAGPGVRPGSTGAPGQAVPARPSGGLGPGAGGGWPKPGGSHGRPGVPIPFRSCPGDRCSCSWTGCPARSGRVPAAQPPAGLLQSVMLALRHRPDILGAHLLPQRIQHRLQRRGAAGRQVPGQPPRTAERRIQVQAPPQEPVITIAVRAADPAPDLLRQLTQPRQVRAALSGGEQDHVRIIDGPLRGAGRSSR